MSVAFSPSRPLPRPDLARLWQDAPGFTGLGLLTLLALVPLCAAMALDVRLFQGESVWAKPIKFHLALAVYLLTLAFYARFLPAPMHRRRDWRAFMAAVTVAVLAELLWVGGAATFNTASHFNTAIPAMTAIYGVMGVFAVLLTSASLVMGVAVWRNRDSGLAPALHLGLALGLILTFALTLPVAGTLSGLGAHVVGPTDGRTLWLMGWARDAGDPRVAHFLATHALHVLPLAGWLAARLLPPAQARPAVLAAAVAFTALVAGTFAQAMLGRPFLPWLG